MGAPPRKESLLVVKRSNTQKQSDLHSAVSEHLAAIRRKGSASRKELQTLDGAMDELLADLRAKAAKTRKK
jgi:hypothetical protein